MYINVSVNCAYCKGNPIAYEPEVEIDTEIDEPFDGGKLKKFKADLTDFIREGINGAIITDKEAK